VAPHGQVTTSGATVRAELAAFAIIAAAFRTAHILTLHAQLIEQRLGLFQIGGVETFGEPDSLPQFVHRIGPPRKSD
jgi:hypothetical protein